MRINDNASVRALPDIAAEVRYTRAGALDCVGMDMVETPVLIVDADGVATRSPARVAAYVNLTRPEARGIHMSRLYLHVDRMLSAEPLTPCSLRRLLRGFLDSHAELSNRAFVRIVFEHLVRRPALASEHGGWRAYPVQISACMEDGGEFSLELVVTVMYSSTCWMRLTASSQNIRF